jgi:hypothetical protein
MPYDQELAPRTGNEIGAQQENFQRYQQVELGDRQPYQQQMPQQQNVPVQQMPPQNPVVQQPADPTAFWASVSNTGYKPSIRLIQNVASLLSNGNSDWADTWFSVLFQKIIKRVKLNQLEGRQK